MNRALLLAVLTMAACPDVYSQGITLSAGETYTYQFSTLPLLGPWNPVEPPPAPFGRLGGAFASFPRGGSIVCEMFEDSSSGVPIATQTWVWPEGSGMPPPPGPALVSSGAWGDLQGTVRFTMVSGSVTIPYFLVDAVRSDSGVFNEYFSRVVPEPGVLSLFCAFVTVMLFSRASVRRLSSNGCQTRVSPPP